MLSLVQEILPPVAQLNSQLGTQVSLPAAASCTALTPVEGDNGNQTEPNTTSQHYAIVESDHPYKPASVASYKVRERIVGSMNIS